MRAAARPGARGGRPGRGHGRGFLWVTPGSADAWPRGRQLSRARGLLCGRWRGGGAVGRWGRGAVGPWAGVPRGEDPGPPYLARGFSPRTHTHTHSLAADTQQWPADAETQGGRLAHNGTRAHMDTRTHSSAGTLAQAHTLTFTATHRSRTVTHCHAHWYPLVNTFLLTVRLAHTGHAPTHINSTPSSWHTHVGLH